MNAELRKMWK